MSGFCADCSTLDEINAELAAKDSDIKTLRRALLMILAHEDGCQKRGFGYDKSVALLAENGLMDVSPP